MRPPPSASTTAPNASDTRIPPDLFLASRGVDNNSISQWRLGYAPDTADRYLQEQGYTPRELVEGGISTRDVRAHAVAGSRLFPQPIDLSHSRYPKPSRQPAGGGGVDRPAEISKYSQTILFDNYATLLWPGSRPCSVKRPSNRYRGRIPGCHPTGSVWLSEHRRLHRPRYHREHIHQDQEAPHAGSLWHWMPSRRRVGHHRSRQAFDKVMGRCRGAPGNQREEVR